VSASNALETGLLLLLFNNTNFALIGDATGLRGSTTAGSLEVSLHTADPGEAGDQTTSEATYTGYARVTVARSGAGWTVSGNAVTNAAITAFPACTGGTNTVTHFGVGTAHTSTGVLLNSGPLNASLAVSNGITPSFDVGQISITAD